MGRATLCVVLTFVGTLVSLLIEVPVIAAAANLGRGEAPASVVATTSRRKTRRDDHVAYTKKTSSGRGTHGGPAADTSSEASPGNFFIVRNRRSRRDSGQSLARSAERTAVSATRRAGYRKTLFALRGGSTGTLEARGGDGREGDEEAEKSAVRSIKVLVSTTKISSYVDARGEVAAQSDWTVERLKEELEMEFPGKIPASVQRLFKGTQLLPPWMTLEEASEGAEGPLILLLDNAPPIDASSFDPDTAVPSRRDGQVEAFSACLAAQSALQEALLSAMRGEDSQRDADLTRSIRMKADFENTQALLRRTVEDVPDVSVPEQETFGVLHEALRPLAHSLDVNWMQSAQRALFAYICAQFGAQGALRRGLTLMLIPAIFLAQTRTARVGMKLARNLVIEVPILTQLFLGLLQAPGQVIMSLDAAAYTRNLYGPGGPKYDAAFLEAEEHDGTGTGENCGSTEGSESEDGAGFSSSDADDDDDDDSE